MKEDSHRLPALIVYSPLLNVLPKDGVLLILRVTGTPFLFRIFKTVSWF